MESFGDAFKKARIAKNKTLREVGERTGKSIGYLSDVQYGRKGAPDLETVRKIEALLGIRDKSLVILAAKSRDSRPSDVARRVLMRPKLAELLMRMEDRTDEEIEQLLATFPQEQEISDAT